MTAIVCHAYSCIFNYTRERCGADQINVAVQNSRVFCSTYRNQDAYDNSADDDNLGMSNAVTVTSAPLVECRASACFYNEKTACYAATIEVLGEHALDSTETRCKTFLPRDSDESGVAERFELELHVD